MKVSGKGANDVLVVGMKELKGVGKARLNALTISFGCILLCNA
jgi:hypothetical protein